MHIVYVFMYVGTCVCVCVCIYVRMCDYVCTYVCMYVHLPHSPRAQLLLFFQAKRIECSDQWEKSKTSLRLLRIISYWSNRRIIMINLKYYIDQFEVLYWSIWSIILIKLIDTSMQLNFTSNNISQCDLILHYMIWFHSLSSAGAIQRQIQEMDLEILV